MVPWFSLVFLAGNALPAVVLSLLWHMLLQAPKRKLSRWWAKCPIFWISRPAPLQWVPASSTVPEFIASEAMHVLQIYQVHLTSEAQPVSLWKTLHGKGQVKFLITNQVLEGKQQTTKATSSVLVIVRFLWGTEAKETNHQRSAPSYLKESSWLLRFCPHCESDSCWVASGVQMKYQIISWGIQLPFLLIF